MASVLAREPFKVLPYALDSMRAFPNDPELSDEVTFILRSLTYYDNNNTKEIFEAGGIPLIVNALNMFKDKCSSDALGLVVNAVMSEDCSKELVKLGILEILVGFFDANLDVNDVGHIIGTLRNLATYQFVMPKFNEMKVTKRVLHQLSKTPNHEYIYEVVFGYLVNVLILAKKSDEAKEMAAHVLDRAIILAFEGILKPLTPEAHQNVCWFLEESIAW
eukprot:CAMPEP_0168513370 /NCGR_PEP_ID=MMETSP0405-20121227/3409_1 /TAXON_ID=498012 /ORGANISM="Trichosphaerium sp, Strain Am-I-7 wt" /LENGTH=218 /DNA_ID=CAMNT_0008532163 /DNA_START=259 /DNA_END=912 /DNA_ORIENTATION=-